MAAGIRLPGEPDPLVTVILRGHHEDIFAELKVNPFADDVVSEPRRVSYSVEGLNATPLQRLIDEFHELTVGDLPRKPAVGRKARLVVSPDRGYGKSHLLGRL
jgi:hypothetical protein